MTRPIQIKPQATAIKWASNLGSLCGCLATLPLMLGSAPSAMAQVTQLEEIVVTASRREGSLQDVAASITALGGDALAARGITNFEDIKRAAAGLYLESPSNSSSSSIRIRGVGTAGNTGIDPSVGVLMDGVYQNFPGMAFTEMMDVERVEVLRGPQGTLFGRNTTAGVIQIHTRSPETDAFSGNVQGVLGNFGNQEVRGAVNIPLIADKLAVRISANDVRRDGYTENTFDGTDTRNQDREGARIKVLWNATEDLEVLWSSGYQATESFNDQGLVIYGKDNVTQGLPISGQPWSVFAAALGKTLAPISLGNASQNDWGQSEDEMERHILTLNWSLPGHTLRSVSAYEDVSISVDQDRDRTSLDLSNLTAVSDGEVLTQEFVLSSEFDSKLSYVLGVFYQEEDLITDVSLMDGSDLIALRRGLALPATEIAVPRDNSSQAVFASATYEFTDELRLTGGVRYTEDTKEMVQTIRLPGPFPLLTTIDGDETFNEWTYSTKLQYDLAPDKMLYLAYDTGFKAGGFNAQNAGCILTGFRFGCLTPDQLNFEPETTDSLEAGIKSEWLDGRLRVNGAVFFQTYEDYHVAEAQPAQAFVLINNAAEVESMGVEFDLTAVLTDHLTLDSSVALVNSEYKEFRNAPCAYPSQPGCVNGVQDLSGELLDNAPETTANAGLDYRAQLGDTQGLEWFARGDVSYRSGTNLHFAQDQQTEQGGYAIYSTQLGLEPVEGDWKVTLWGRNLTDKKYAQIGGADVGGINLVQGLPRTFGVTADWQF